MAYYSYAVYSKQQPVSSINTDTGLFSLGSLGSLFNNTHSEPSKKTIKGGKKMGNTASVTPAERPPNSDETSENPAREGTEKTTPEIVIDDVHGAPGDGEEKENDENEYEQATSEHESKTSAREPDEEMTTDARKSKKGQHDTLQEGHKKQRSQSYSQISELDKSMEDALEPTASAMKTTQSTTALDWLLGGFKKEQSTGSNSSLDAAVAAAPGTTPPAKPLWPFFAPAPPPPPSEEEKKELERLEAAIGDMDVPWGLNRGGEDAWTAEMKQKGGLKHPRHDKIIGYHSLPPPFSPKHFTSPLSEAVGSPRAPDMGGGTEGMLLSYR